MSRKKGIVVLSAFDGMSCGQLALKKAGIPVKTYYASEINKYAIKVTQHNFPNTIQLGSITNVHAKDLPKIDLFIGGSPCQGFSNAGTGLNFDHPESNLFFEFVRLKNELTEINPKLKFLLENVQMKKEWENIISRYMGINPVKINSALVSAQNRVRLYWNNFNIQKYGLFDHEHNVIHQPKDKKIFLKDILDNEVDEKYFLSDKMINYLNTRKANFNAGKINYKQGDDKAACINKSSKSLDISDNIILTPVINNNGVLSEKNKSTCLDANYKKGVDKHGARTIIIHNTQPRSGDPKKGGTGHLSRTDGKTYCLDTGNTNAVEVKYTQNYIQWDTSGKGHDSHGQRAYFTDKKMGSLMSDSTASKTNILFNSRIRRLTPDECARLQTVDPQYFKDENGKYIVSESRIYEMLGNGWTVDVIAHQLEYYKQIL